MIQIRLQQSHRESRGIIRILYVGVDSLSRVIQHLFHLTGEQRR